jgi:hypothetical protein
MGHTVAVIISHQIQAECRILNPEPGPLRYILMEVGPKP